MIPLRDANPTRRTPLVTLAIVVACFVAFAWELGLLARGGEAALDAFVTSWGVVPADVTAAWSRGDILSRATATLIASQFLHGSWLHWLLRRYNCRTSSTRSCACSEVMRGINTSASAPVASNTPAAAATVTPKAP